MIEIVKYSPENKRLWDDFVEGSKNGTFLFKRDYMDYHSDRFQDNSFLIYRKGKLYCLLPANIKEDVLYSHQGLTYGGVVMSDKCTAEGILDVFSSLRNYLSNRGVKKIIYKPVPYIYSSRPSQEDLYALFRLNANLIIRNISSTINISSPLKFIKDRRAALRKGIAAGLLVEESDNLAPFWRILEDNLAGKYGATPVHSLSEMENLKAKFPGNIRLYLAKKEENVLGGILCYITENVVHAQYISASLEGKECGAIDLLMDFLIHEKFTERNYFDLGTSNEDGGRYLNETLIYQKEGFGGRAVCYDTYEIPL
ncbi:MAG: GNAT family N-acetyltransferase [Muribaculaceae bacterium]|nr:GNAT family N-acetyltransferase [Muribaculaceae bacterium]